MPGSDVIMAATYKVETNDEGGYTVTVVGFLPFLVNGTPLLRTIMNG